MQFLSRSISRLIVIALLATSCTHQKPINLREWSEGLNTDWVSVREHKLLVLEKISNDHQKEIHFYIEGDGTPWVTRYLMAENPTPRYPLALALMKRDPNLSFYLGRPCYYQPPEFYSLLNQPDNTDPCNFHYWTDARYSPEVVDLMKIAIEDILKKLPQDKKSLPIIMIGHSGGGTLAMLLAQRLEEVSGVITIAANMDTAAWTKRQGYSPLKKSLNLISETHLRNIPQVHFAGSIDDVVPPEINQPLMQKLQRELTIIEGFDHSCCWLDEWPTLLQRAEQQLQQQALK